MKPRRPVAALTLLCTLLVAAPAAGQVSGAALVGPLERSPAIAESRSRLPIFRMPEGDLREVGVPRRNGLIGAIAINDRLDVGIGRFNVTEIARPRTHMEADRQPTAVRPRDRGIAAIGFSLRFR